MGCLGIKGEKIVSLGSQRQDAAWIVDARGKIVCPGFIDVHSHGDFAAASWEKMKNTICQGVTTIVTGNCGFSVFPVQSCMREEITAYGAGVLGKPGKLTCEESFGEYCNQVSKAGSYVNLASLVGQGTLYKNCYGLGKKGHDISAALHELRHQMEEGAAGLSLGLIYSPGVDTPGEELMELAKAVAQAGKILTVHLRDEGRNIRKSMDEILEIARVTGVHVHFSHHKIMGREFWGGSRNTLRMIEEAETRGIEVSLDAYPYDAGCSTALVLLPPWVVRKGVKAALALLQMPDALEKIRRDVENGMEGWEDLIRSCGWENLVITRAPGAPPGTEGKSLEELGAWHGCSRIEALARLLVICGGDVSILIRGMSGDDVDRIICHPKTLVGSDSLYSEGATHPRRSGTFPKIIREYVKQRKILSLETAVYKMTGMAADVFRIPGRGRLKAGNAADILIFDPETFSDPADYFSPNRICSGAAYLWMNGRCIIRQGVPDDLAAGKVLRI